MKIFNWSRQENYGYNSMVVLANTKEEAIELIEKNFKEQGKGAIGYLKILKEEIELIKKEEPFVINLTNAKPQVIENGGYEE